MRLSAEQRVAIVGAGHSGGRVALHLRACGFKGEIVVIGEEPDLPYERPPLSKEYLLTNEGAPHAGLSSEIGWREVGVRLCLGTKAINLQPSRKRLHLSDGQVLDYDRVVLAMGAAPRELAALGGNGGHVLSLRTLAEATELRRRLGYARRMAIVGGGVIGLEVASIARKRGIEVVVLEVGDRLMARVAPPLISAWIASLHQDKGVELHLNTAVRTMEYEPEGNLRIVGQQASGAMFETQVDLAVVAIGVVPRTEWLASSGLPLSDGVVVDAYCRSPADASCYAVGDVANTWHGRYGRSLRQETWRNAENQGRAVAEFLCGREAPYVETPWMWSDQYEANIQILGIPATADSHIIRGDMRSNSFSWIGLCGDSIVSAVLINSARERRVLESIIEGGKRVDLGALGDRQVDLKRLCA